VHIQDADAKRAGRAFSQAAVELALASYPGCTLTTSPGDASPFGVFRAEYLPQTEVPHVAVLPDGTRVPIEAPTVTADDTGAARATARPGPYQGTLPAASAPQASRKSKRSPLGTVVGARSGDKGGDANLGLWARSDEGYAWLRGFLDVGTLKRLLPECSALDVDRYELPNLRALNFVIHGLLGEGVAASTRFDPQAKALGEWLRSRVVEIPEALL
jgi:hypothetical protein